MRPVRTWLSAKREAAARWWALRDRTLRDRTTRYRTPRDRGLWREARALYADPVHGPAERELLRRRIDLWHHREAARAELDSVRAELVRAELRALDEPALFHRIFGDPPPPPPPG
ncbi:hypothetical protein AB0O07_32435 [Streptomyces sp. NPDC093085]|uniref:hypothetical protein n=1 Tax=Streptomyces sp. NPDC093085 TaxID=3155068 RepID=UPI0034278704